MRTMIFQSLTEAFRKDNPSIPHRSRTYDLLISTGQGVPVTSSS